MKDELSEEQAKAILKALDDALEEGPWESSNFLKIIGKNLRAIRDNYCDKFHLSQAEKVSLASNASKQVGLRDGQQEVFIGLYLSNGSNLQNWEKIIHNLPRQNISRPVYDDEKNVNDLIKSKENKINEGYVSVYVNQSDILPVSADKAPVERLGHRLLLLRDRAIYPENINRFVHQSGTYTLQNGRLIKTAS